MSKPRSPGFQPGNNWVIDDLTGHARRRGQIRYRWDGIALDQKEWEPRHPQDFVRSRKDKITPDEPIRADQAPGSESFTSVTYAQDLDTIPSGHNNGEL